MMSAIILEIIFEFQSQRSYSAPKIAQNKDVKRE